MKSLVMALQWSNGCKCRVCGKYFVPYSKASIYCHNANLDYHGEKCSDIGPRLARQGKVADNELLKFWETNYKSYHQWVARLKRQKAICKEIKAEIEKNFHTWCCELKATLNDYEKMDSPDLHQFAFAIALPDIARRSPKLAAYRVDARAEKGNY